MTALEYITLGSYLSCHKDKTPKVLMTLLAVPALYFLSPKPVFSNDKWCQHLYKCPTLPYYTTSLWFLPRHHKPPSLCPGVCWDRPPHHHSWSPPRAEWGRGSWRTCSESHCLLPSWINVLQSREGENNKIPWTGGSERGRDQRPVEDRILLHTSLSGWVIKQE